MRRKILIPTLITMAFAFVLVACAPNPTPEPTPTPTEIALTPTPEPEPEPPEAENTEANPPFTGDNFVQTDSGLQYEDVVVGDGEAIAAGDVVAVHYTLYLEDGSKVDSSLDRGQAFLFQAGRGWVIPGWDEGVVGLNIGGQRKLIIPSELGYGPTGAGGVSPPNATLYFEVEALEKVPLGIEDVVVGEGAEAVPGSVVSVHYVGTLEDGTQFDSSVDKGTPFEFQIGMRRVIPGWEYGIPGMKEGGKRILTIPSSLGYGPNGSGTIPPNATLIFEVELLEVR